jgi:hypothetical protein
MISIRSLEGYNLPSLQNNIFLGSLANQSVFAWLGYAEK